MPLKLEIVTPVHNRREETLLCLKSLSRSRLDGIDVNTIIVDDGSTDGTRDAVNSEFPEITFVHGDGSLWYTAGTNRGLEEAMRNDPDYVLAINNDSVFDENCISNLVQCAESNPGSVVGPLLLNWCFPHKIFQVAPKWDFWRGGIRHWQKQSVWTVPRYPWEVELIVGNCVLFPAAAIREVGYMDEKRLRQYGDAEYTPRMRRKGWKLLIEPRARAFCKPNDVNAGYRRLPFTKKIQESFLNPTSPYSFKRRLYGNLAAGPNRTEALLAIPIFYARIILGLNSEGKWALEQDEPPLSKIFADAVTDD